MQFGWTADEAASSAIMDEFVQAGGNFIDTADIYTTWGSRGLAGGGGSEEIIGRWMKARGNRSKVIVATKVRGKMAEGAGGEGLSRERVIRCCEDSLRRLQTDHIDLYQCHWADLSVPIEETLGALDQLVQAGKVRAIGASNYPAWRLMEALGRSDQRGLARFNSYQPEYSLMERALFEMEAQPLCRHYRLGVIPYSPLAGGFLTGKYRRGGKVESVRATDIWKKYGTDRGFSLIEKLDEIGRSHGKTVAQTALAWLLGNPVVTSAIVGANTPQQLRDSFGAVGYRLDAEEMKALAALTDYPRNSRPIWD
ncbi:MAG: aldo/keto reductase [Verrucomicrobia bacterium]|nr:aldo/keto reductase [Verrucomicrobiota bacterium]